MVRLDEAAIDRALSLVSSGLDKYCRIQAALPTVDVTRDRSFQTRFNAFYRLRRAESWRSAFYALMELEKSCRRSFPAVLRSLHAATGRVEASFASKLAATVDPDKPVIDSFVLKNLALRLPPPGGAEKRLARIEAMYDRLGQMYIEFLGSQAGRYLVARFAEAYPSQPVTPVKMLDLVLWQTRQTAEPGAPADSCRFS